MNVFNPNIAVYTESKKSLSKYRNQAMIAARDLGYGHAVIKKVKEAKTEGQIIKIMIEARKRSFT